MTTTDSASGSAKAARDSRFQAIMPIRGKILNLEKATREAMLNNEEVKTLILAFGCGFEETFDITKLRFGKIILLPDADSDGHHIGVLLLTFIFKLLPELISAGHVYIGLPPLYAIKRNTITPDVLEYAWSDDEKDKLVEKYTSKAGTKPYVQRYKGLTPSSKMSNTHF